MTGNGEASAGWGPPGALFGGVPGYAVRTPWSPLHAAAAVVLILLASVAVPWLLVDLARRLLGQPIATEQWADVAARVLVVGLTLAASVLLGGRARDVLALRRPARGWRSYAGAALLLLGVPILLAIALAVAVIAFGQLDWLMQAVLDDRRSLQPVPGAQSWAFILLAVVVAPVEEELLFRGFLLSALAKSRIGFWGAAAVSTGLWMVLHEYSILGYAKVFVLGMLFSWLLWRTGSLRVTIFAHALNNLLALALLQVVDVRP
jgi:membrane protease YdiL (CAAX protease family)